MMRHRDTFDFMDTHPILAMLTGFLIMLAANIIFWGGLIWATLALLNHYGVI